MIREQISKLRARLLGDEKRIEKELVNLSLPELDRDAGRIDEEADAVEEETARFALAQSMRRRLGRIKAALSKMKKGSYGICENCGKEIELKLLEVDPESRLCRECKRKHG